MAQPSEVYNLTFNRVMIDTPILHSIGKRFRVTVNLRRAILNEDGGSAEVQFTGPAEEIGRAIADLQTTGVIVSGPINDPIQPDYSQSVPVTIGRGT